MASKFYYFGFGSNMLAQRIHIQNPKAERLSAGVLKDYSLDFHTSSKTWQGAPATIVPDKGAFVHGAIWEIDSCHLNDLDDQEGVHLNIYTAFTAPVFATNLKKTVECRAYHLVKQPEPSLKLLQRDTIPYDRQPSMTYLKTIVKGAKETGVPEEYVKFLKSIRHNNKLVDNMEDNLDLHNVEL